MMTISQPEPDMTIRLLFELVKGADERDSQRINVDLAADREQYRGAPARSESLRLPSLSRRNRNSGSGSPW
jgi:hypothetical protein